MSFRSMGLNTPSSTGAKPVRRVWTMVEIMPMILPMLDLEPPAGPHLRSFVERPVILDDL